MFIKPRLNGLAVLRAARPRNLPTQVSQTCSDRCWPEATTEWPPQPAQAGFVVAQERNPWARLQPPALLVAQDRDPVALLAGRDLLILRQPGQHLVIAPVAQSDYHRLRHPLTLHLDHDIRQRRVVLREIGA